MHDPPTPSDRFADAYDELRRLARAQLRRHERTGLLDTTALVHESWLRVAQSKGFGTPSAAAATRSARLSTAASSRT